MVVEQNCQCMACGVLWAVVRTVLPFEYCKDCFTVFCCH